MSSVLDFQAPEHGRTPVLVEVPHAGLAIPSSLQGEILASEEVRKRDADLYVDELFALAPAAGAALLSARISRYVADLNRAPDDVEAGVFDELTVGEAASSSSRFGHTPRQPRGVVWRVTTDGRPVLRTPLNADSLRQRIALYHSPYHARLLAELEATRKRFGYVILVAGHSMPSAVRRGTREIERRADIVPGSLGRTSTDPRVIDLVEQHFRAAGLSVRHDEPYRGGFTTAHYGCPPSGQHAIQIEINRALYMDEQTCERKPEEMASLQLLLKDLVTKLGQLRLD
ncbi:MAG: N-formylglutamate deformylase [Myxococcaceae bacterium]|nr:N-formylglutamate deformylase [Myxococcaceae bacterium]